MPNLTVFLSYVFISTFTPGPNNIMCLSNASQHGFKSNIRFLFGIFFGFIIILTIGSIFSVSLYTFLPSIKPIMTLVGAAYILWLAWKTLSTHGPVETNSNKRAGNTFSDGILLQFLNPKVILFSITVLSTFITPYYESKFAIGGFVIFISFVGLMATTSWSVFGAVFQKFLNRYAKMINIAMAILLVYCAISLFL